MATETEVLMLRLEANMKRYEAALARAQGQSNKAFGSIENRAKQMETSLAKIGQSVVTIGASMGLAFGGGQLIGGLAETALQFDRINKALVVATGSSAGAAAEMAFIRSTATALGLELGSAAQQYAFLAAASRGTALEGQKTRDIFVGVSSAASALGLTAADTAGVLNAVQQMISKGVVSAEELRGQMGERLPGAFAAAARAMNMTTEELGKQLELGNIAAEDLLPKLAAELTKLGGNATGLQADLNRLNNAYTELQLAFANTGGIDTAVVALQSLANTLNFVTRAVQRGTLDDMFAGLAGGITGYARAAAGIAATMAPESKYRTGGQMMDSPVRNAAAGAVSNALEFLAQFQKPEAPQAPRLPRVSGGGGRRSAGGGARRASGGGGSSAANDARQYEAALADLNFELEKFGMTSEQASYADELRQNLARAGVSLESERGQQIALITSQIFEQTAAIEAQAAQTEDLGAKARDVAQRQQEWADRITDAFEAVILRGEDVKDVLAQIGLELARSGLRSALSGIAGGLGGEVESIFGAIFGRASGGPVNAGQAYRVGETGPELFIPRGPGRITRAGGAQSSGQMNITVDLRGNITDAGLAMQLRQAAKAGAALAITQSKRNLGTNISELQARR